MVKDLPHSFMLSLITINCGFAFLDKLSYVSQHGLCAAAIMINCHVNNLIIKFRKFDKQPENLVKPQASNSMYTRHKVGQKLTL